MGMDETGNICFGNHSMGLEDEAIKLRKRKRNSATMADTDCHITTLDKFYKRVVLYLSKPSYLLRLGSNNLRAENRSRLRCLLQKLVRQHDWTEASGVLSVLLKGTCKDNCPATNRFKYSAAMELLAHVESSDYNLMAIGGIYDTWMRRIGINLSDKRRIGCLKEDSFVVRLESILFNLMQGNVEGERQNARSLLQEREFENHPMFKMVVGLVFYQLWYSRLPEEMQWKDCDQFYTPPHSDMQVISLQSYVSSVRFSYEARETDGRNAGFDEKSDNSFQYESETSVMNDKRIVVVDTGREVASLEIDNLHKENHIQDFQPQGFYVKSIENDASFSNGHMQSFQNFSSLKSLDSWLLPIQTENWEVERVIQDEDYRNAVKYLQQAVNSTPPVLVALLPLIQLLLIGCEDKEALNELEKFCGNLNTALPIRIRANLLECVNPNNSVMLSTCFEDALKSDPTCSKSLAELISLHKKGDYGSGSLLEMIALHLDAVFANHDTWREFALCFYEIFRCEEDCASVLPHGSGCDRKQRYSVCYRRIPKLFTHGRSGKAWRFRCRWWLKRHFSSRMLASEITAGDLQLITFKAACGGYLYGQESEYVVKVYKCLEKEENKDLVMFLKRHMQGSIGIDSKH